MATQTRVQVALAVLAFTIAAFVGTKLASSTEAPRQKRVHGPTVGTGFDPGQAFAERKAKRFAAVDRMEEQREARRAERQAAREAAANEAAQSEAVVVSAGVSSLCGSSCIACESGWNAQIVSASGTYWGLYQFDYGTWVAHGGNPESYGNAPASEQHAVATRVTYDAWPNC